MSRLALISLVLACTTGCLPFATLPLELEGGGGFSVGRKPAAGLSARATFSPFTVLGPDWVPRRYDVAVGYGAEFIFSKDTASSVVQHGPLLKLAYWAWGEMSGTKKKPRVWRLGFRSIGQLLNSGDDFGGSASVGAVIEWARFVKGGAAGASGQSAGGFAGIGELGFGSFLDVGYQRVGVSDRFFALAGISVRLPLGAGVICCALPR